jgi:hypothetical protein
MNGVIVLEGDRDHGVAVPPAGGQLVGCEVLIGHGNSLRVRRVIGRHAFRMIAVRVLEASHRGGHSAWPII